MARHGGPQGYWVDDSIRASFIDEARQKARKRAAETGMPVKIHDASTGRWVATVKPKVTPESYWGAGALRNPGRRPQMTAFIQGFIKATGMGQQEASEQWDAFSRMLSNKEIQKIERGGYSSGLREGKQFRKMYPDEGSEENPSIKAQVRRLPSGEIQLKVPVKRGENPMAKARQLAKALGRKITSVAHMNGGRMCNPGGMVEVRHKRYAWGDLWLKVNLSQASAPILYGYEEGDWRHSPYQTADARHNLNKAFALVNQWLRSQAG